MNQIIPLPIDGAFYMDSVFEAPPAPILAPEKLFGTGTVEHIVSSIETEVRAEVYDVTTPEGRERIKSVAYKVARSKTTLDEIGKEHVAHIKAQSAAIDKERKSLRDRLDALKEEVRGPLTAWEAAEADRVTAHEDALVVILKAPADCQMLDVTSEGISRIKAGLEELAGRNWQEFGDRAAAAFAETMPKLVALRDAAEQHERDQAELAELRKLKAEREEADRIAAAAAQAAEKSRQEAEQKAARDAAEAERVAEWQRKRDEQAERDVQAAVARAIEADRRIQEESARAAAAKKAAEEAAERKRQENKRHREKIHREVIAALEPLPANAASILEAIKTGRIPHVSITY